MDFAPVNQATHWHCPLFLKASVSSTLFDLMPMTSILSFILELKAQDMISKAETRHKVQEAAVNFGQNRISKCVNCSLFSCSLCLVSSLLSLLHGKFLTDLVKIKNTTRIISF
jgi:hypothetical protein